MKFLNFHVPGLQTTERLESEEKSFWDCLVGKKLWLYAHAVRAPHAASPLDDRTARSRGSPRRCLFPGLEGIPFRSSQQSSLSSPSPQNETHSALRAGETTRQPQLPQPLVLNERKSTLIVSMRLWKLSQSPLNILFLVLLLYADIYSKS